MYPLDATKENFETVEILGIPALFTTLRINRSTVPKGMYLYEMQTDEEDWSRPCLLGRRIMVEHFGSVLTASPIDLPNTGYLDLKPGDFTMGTGGYGVESLTVAEFEDKYLGRHPLVRHARAHKPHRASAPVR